MGRKSSWTGVLTSSDINQYLQDQAIQTYATEAARNAALPSPLNGQFAFTTDTGTVWIYNGSVWVEYGTNFVWKSWTPTLTNMTLGNGTLDCQYFKIGRTVHYKFRFNLGTTSTMGTSPYFSLPFGFTDATEIECGLATAVDSSTAARYPFTQYAIGGGAGLLCLNSAGTYVVVAGVTATVPFTWANTDVIMATGTYEASS
jgi:hypothetical protein